MKLLITFCLVVFSILSGRAQADTSDFKKLYWLIGTWQRTNVKPGRSGTERWAMVSTSELKGLGITLRGNDTAFIERIRLILKDGNIYYAADVPENKGVVLFKLTSIAQNGFVCENPAHDFPKKISYQRDGNNLKAVISGDGKSADYLFEKNN